MEQSVANSANVHTVNKRRRWNTAAALERYLTETHLKSWVQRLSQRLRQHKV